MINNRLPRHPLVAKGYPSIGCAPCTTPVKPGEDPRATMRLSLQAISKSSVNGLA
jgi:3'-phosphoadenosine 5'-phosphosulfate sulfotransferase (PAPS reductase)/FAD synthetase